MNGVSYGELAAPSAGEDPRSRGSGPGPAGRLGPGRMEVVCGVLDARALAHSDLIEKNLFCVLQVGAGRLRVRWGCVHTRVVFRIFSTRLRGAYSALYGAFTAFSCGLDSADRRATFKR